MEQKETIFIDGMSVKHPKEGVPDFIKANISVNVEKFTNFAQIYKKNGWINIDLKKSKEGNLYFSLNTFVPKSREVDGFGNPL